MKKTTAFLAALAVSLFCVNASAQAPQKESYLFNHWSVGLGILEDFHVQVAGTILPNLQVRLLYSTLTPYVGIANAATKKSIGGINPYRTEIPVGNNGIHQNGLNIDKINLEANLHSRELQLMLDFFPSTVSSFHFTGGVIFDITPNIVTASGTPVSNDGSAALQPSDMGKKEIAGITTDLNGIINLRASYGLPTIRPYIGFGFGRPVDVQKRVSVNFDLGIAYIGGLHVYGENYMTNYPEPTTVELTSEWLNTAQVNGKSVAESLGSKSAKIAEYVDMANSFPILPYARLAVNVRLF